MENVIKLHGSNYACLFMARKLVLRAITMRYVSPHVLYYECTVHYIQYIERKSTHVRVHADYARAYAYVDEFLGKLQTPCLL